MEENKYPENESVRKNDKEFSKNKDLKEEGKNKIENNNEYLFKDNMKENLSIKSEDLNKANITNNVSQTLPKSKKADDKTQVPLDKKADDKTQAPLDNKADDKTQAPLDKKADDKTQAPLDKKAVENESNIAKNIRPEPIKAKAKPVKELPIEKKPFSEFVNLHLLPEIEKSFKLISKEVTQISFQNTERPIAGDKCWVIYCEVKDTCNFWLSFEKEDIMSPKSFSLCKAYEKPSILESFLIDEKKITLKLIISRILQRLNGQKLIGAN